MLPIECADINNMKLKYKVFGQGKVDLIIELALGATAGEWWHIAEKLSSKYTVLLYERSRSVSVKRTPNNIAVELYTLLEKIPHKEQIIIVAHSQGGLYAQQFARLYPDLVKGIVLLDPLSAYDNRFREFLTPKEMKQSGVDKTGSIVLMKTLAALHLGFLIKAVMKKAPPFYYYKNFSDEAADYILSSITKLSIYESALEEYRLSHEEQEISPLKDKMSFPDIPIFLITHTRRFSVEETMKFGKVSKNFAEKVENIWQSVMKEYLKLSSVHKYTEALSSGHFIHLTEPNLIDEGLLWVEQNLRAK